MATLDPYSPWLTAEQIAADPAANRSWHDLIVRSTAVTGNAPFTLVRTFNAPEDFDVEANVPPGLAVCADSINDTGRQYLLTGDGATVALHALGRRVDLYASAETVERRDRINAFFNSRFPTERSDPKQVRVSFVLNDQGLRRVPRWVQARSWPDTRGHYPVRAAGLLDQLMAVEPDPSGRVVLLHGPPGAGKSSALLTLAREWREWCRFSFVLDPDALFSGEPTYLLNLGSDVPDDHWQMLVIEDAAELLSPTGHGGMHPGLARLLNLTDGALGQGLRLMVCVTTNEPLIGVHQALRRPGRCLANIHIGSLAPNEANALLPAHRRADRPLTLAEVLERRGELSILGDGEEPIVSGVYL